MSPQRGKPAWPPARPPRSVERSVRSCHRLGIALRLSNSAYAHCLRASLRAARLLALASAVACHDSSHAQDFGDPRGGVDEAKVTEVRDWLAQLDLPAVSWQVELALSRPHQLRSASLTEDTLPSQGCVYRTSDRERIAAIAKLLREAHPVPASVTADRMLERMITFSFADGSTRRINFGEVLDSDRNLHAASQGEALFLDSAFGDQLLHWAASFHQKNRCADFVDKY